VNAALKTCLGPTGFFMPGGNDCVLLVHGLTGTPAEMRAIAKRLAKQGFNVVCPQLAGHCGTVNDLKRSKWRDWYDTVERTFEAAKQTHARVYVAGLSMGALIALKLAEEKGARVDGLGLLSVTFFYDGWNMPHIRRKLLLPLVIYSPLRYFVSWRENPPYGIKCDRTRAAMHKVLTRRDAKASQKVGIFSTPAITIHESLRLIRVAKAALPRVHSPALIVHSTEDDTASIKNAHYVAERISSGKVETYFVDDTYHVLTMDKRKSDVARRLADFFKGCTYLRAASN
jgi:carboxylesterase